MEFTNIWLQYRKNVYIVMLDEMVYKYSNILMMLSPIDILKYNERYVQNNDKDPKFKVFHHVRKHS